MKYIQLTKGRHAIIDDEDFEEINKYKWYVSTLGYAVTGHRIGSKVIKIYMHRLIARTAKGLETDHINHNTLDNRRKNLRSCTQSQNQMNKNKYSKKGTVKGVYNTGMTKNPFKSAISVNRKYVHLGYYKTEQDAANAYNVAAIKYFGEFAHINQLSQPQSHQVQ